MNRRMLMLYTGMMMAGITAGYLCWEKDRIAEGILLLLATSSAVALLYLEVGRHYGLRRRQLWRMTGMMLCGFLLFSLHFNRLYVSDALCETDSRGTISVRILKVQEYDEHTDYIAEAQLLSGKRKILCKDYSEDREILLVGTLAEVRGKLRIPDGQRNPNCFNYRLYLKTKGIVYTMTAKSIRAISLSNEPGYRFDRMLVRLQNHFLEYFWDNSDVRGFLRGILFGERSELDEEIYTEFSENGTAHILAVSGLHVGFLIALLTVLARNRKYWKVTVAIFGVLILYGEITSWSASTIRAVLIAILSMSSMYLRRPFDLTTGTAASAMLMLLVRPYFLFQTGFLMSFLAIVGMAFLTGPLSHFVGKGMAAMLSVQLIMIPIQVYSFHRFNPLTIVINIPIIFLASVLVPCGVVLFLIGSVVPMGDFPVRCLMLMTELLIRLNRLLYFDGTFSAMLPSVGVGLLILLYGGMLFGNSEWFRILILRKDYRALRKTLVILLIPAVMVMWGFRNPLGNDGVVFVDVGQGAGIHLRSGGRNVLIDGGGNANYSVGEKVLEPYFLGNGVTSLDYAICTHLHMDHFQGVQELSADFPIENFAVPSVYRGLSETPASAKFLEIGQTLRISKELSIKVLWPAGTSQTASSNAGKNGDASDTSEKDTSEMDENEMTGVYRIEYRGLRILVTGDILEAGERDVVQYYAGTDELRCHVLAVAHHGSHSSSCDEFLDAVSPRIAVIQVGSRNLYGHPHAETIEKLTKRGISIYRTDLHGAIGLQVSRWNSSQLQVDRMIEVDG